MKKEQFKDGHLSQSDVAANNRASSALVFYNNFKDDFQNIVSIVDPSGQDITAEMKKFCRISKGKYSKTKFKSYVALRFKTTIDEMNQQNR